MGARQCGEGEEGGREEGAPRFRRGAGRGEGGGRSGGRGGAGLEEEGEEVGEGSAAVGDGGRGVLRVAGNGEEAGDVVEDEGAFAGGWNFAGEVWPGGGDQEEEFALGTGVEEGAGGFSVPGEAFVAQEDDAVAGGVGTAQDFAFAVGEAGADEDGAACGKVQGFRALGLEFGGGGFDEGDAVGISEDAPGAAGEAFAAVAEVGAGALDGMDDGPIEKGQVAQSLEVQRVRGVGKGEAEGDVFDAAEEGRVGAFAGQAFGVAEDVALHAAELAFSEEDGVDEAGSPASFAAAGLEAADDIAEGFGMGGGPRRFRRGAGRGGAGRRGSGRGGGGEGGADEEEAVEVVGHDDGGEESDLGPVFGDAGPTGKDFGAERGEGAGPAGGGGVLDGPGGQGGAAAVGKFEGDHVDGAGAVVPVGQAAAHAVVDCVVWHWGVLYAGGETGAKKKTGRTFSPSSSESPEGGLSACRGRVCGSGCGGGVRLFRRRWRRWRRGSRCRGTGLGG